MPLEVASDDCNLQRGLFFRLCDKICRVHTDACIVYTAAAPFEFEFEEAQLTEQNVRDLVYEEMRFYHPEL